MRGSRRRRDTRGEGYVDVAVSVMVFALLLAAALSAVSLAALSQNLKAVADDLAEYASTRGTVAIAGYADELRRRTGIAFVYTCGGSELYDSSGRVQLGDRIVCAVTYQLRASGFGGFTLPIRLRASSSGLSRVYWK